MAGYRALPLAPVSASAMAATVSAQQPNGPTMYASHHQSMTAMTNNSIIYQSAVHASIHSLNTVQNQHRSTTTHHHHIVATATATAAAAAAVAATAVTARQFSAGLATGTTPPPLPPPPPPATALAAAAATSTLPALAVVNNSLLPTATQLVQQQQQQQQQHQQHQQHQQQYAHMQQQHQQQPHHHQQQQQHQQQLQAAAAAAAAHHHHHHHHHHHQQLALHQNHLYFGLGDGHHRYHHHHHRQIFSQLQSAIMPLSVNGEPIKLPDNLESLPRADSFPSQRHRWNTNEEIAALLISFDKHGEWQSKEVKTRPKSGSLLLYSRKKVRYRRDGYCWKKRKDGKTTREDHMKLKVQGTECIYGCYVHSAILPTFHRRCYWLLQNPDIVLVHYLNVPYPDDNKMAVITPSITLWGDKKEWTKEELVSQLKPMLSTVTSDDDSDSGNDIEISTAETVESIVCQLMEKQRFSRQAALVKQLDCGCGDANCADGKTCTQPIMRRTGLLKSVSEKRFNHIDNPNQATNGSPNVVMASKLYSRWSERHRQQRDLINLDNQHAQYHNATQQLPQESAIKFQIIPPQQQQPQQPQQPQQQQNEAVYYQQQHYRNQNQMLTTRNNLMMQQQQQTHFMHNNQQRQNTVSQLNLRRFVANQSNNNSNNNNGNNNNNNDNDDDNNSNRNNNDNNDDNDDNYDDNKNKNNNNNNNNNSNNNNNNNNNSSGSISSSNSTQLNHRLQIANITITPTTAAAATAPTSTATAQEQQCMNAELIGNATHHNSINVNANTNKMNRNTNNNNDLLEISQQHQQHEQHEQQGNNLNVIYNNSNSSNNNFTYNQQQHISILSTPVHQQQQKQQQQFYKLQQQPQGNNQANTNNLNSLNINTSSVEPMCMSPEHQPTTTHNTNHNQNNNHQIQPLQVYFSSLMTSGCTSSASSTSSSLQSIIDNKIVNQQSPLSLQQQQKQLQQQQKQQSQEQRQQSMPADDNLMATEIVAGVECEKKKLSQKNASNDNANNNHVTEYNTRNKTDNGCVHFNASSDNSLSSQASSSNDVSNTVGFDNNNNNNSNNKKNELSNNSNNNNITNSNNNELQDNLGFFNETLDLSHEDIQRTLIANMPYTTTNSTKEELDYINNANTNANGSNNNQRYTQSTDNKKVSVPPNVEQNVENADDVFANLDAFDMLVEFPELDLDDKQALSNTALEQYQQDLNHFTYAVATETIDATTQAVTQCQDQRKLLTICDFSPEWSYPEGGVKVLVAGPWTSNDTYTVFFDAQPVPTVLVQEGVLRCYCPAHEVGFVSLQVACGGYIVSNSVMFEYKMSLLVETPFDTTASNDCLYKFALLNRLSNINEKLQIKAEVEAEAEVVSNHTLLYTEPNFEEKLIRYCHKLKNYAWCANGINNWSGGFRGMSLLHLASALGYAKLICALLNWRTENPHIILETELDALSQDIYGYTPLAWACVRGHTDCVSILFNWNHNALKIKNKTQQTPLDLAHLKGYKQLLEQIYRLENERIYKQQTHSSFMSLSSINNNNRTLHCNGETESERSSNGYELALQHNGHDGVFLRPVTVTSNQSPPNNMHYSKRSSIDSGINMDIRSKSGKPLSRRHGSYEVHENYALAVESPLDTLSTANSLLSPLRKMDFALCEVSTGDSSPIHDKVNDCDDNSTIISEDVTDVTISNEISDAVVGDSDAKVLTLAEHIIAAMPERIKNEAYEMMVLGSPMTEPLNSESSGLTESFMNPLLETLPNTHFENDFHFDFHDHNYRYHDVSTPCSSLSPASSGPLQSPASYSILGTDPSVSSPSPPPSTKQLTEFLHASSSNNQYPFEADFSKLTLTDTEQRELYEAAKCIQKAYRSYKGRQKLEEQNKERSAAIVIQNYYRRYKQFAYYRQMTNAALVIQHGYRSYRRNKRFKKSQITSVSTAATDCGLTGDDSEHNSISSSSQCLSSFYDHYKQEQQHELSSQSSTPKETSPSGPLKRTYSQSTQNQAARKIQQFMRQSRIKLQKERAEKEKLVHQRRAEYLQNLQYQGQQEMSMYPRENKL